MDNKKFERLIDLIINEDQERASALFHEIVVEKSREIYENIMDEEEGMVGEVGDLMDEINAEESGVMEEDDDEEGSEEDIDFGDDDEDGEVVDIDMGDDEEGDEESHEEIEDAVIRIEDKLDQLMAEFEEIMGQEEGEEDFDAGEEDEEAGEEEGGEVMEAIQLKQVSAKHGDDGDQRRSPTTFNSGQAGMDSRPVKFSGDTESVPTGPKGPSNFYSKGEKEVKGAGQFKNAPAQNTQDLESAPKPVKSQASGVNNTSPVAESKKTKKKIVR